ncbi:MAG: cyclase family protein [Saprospiraceae bacterium]|nr:cyclase family protein [Saprospiraceae bacterium]
MKVQLTHGTSAYEVDLSRPIDISIPIRNGEQNPNCFYAPMPEFSPVRAGDFVGATAEGGAVNFFNVRINPHGNGTHTECVGHIALEKFTIRETLTQSHFLCKLVSVIPTKNEEGDKVIYRHHLEGFLEGEALKAIIVRTMPNDEDKTSRSWSGTNPTYFDAAAIRYLVENGIQHFLTDLPSVDREEDGGALAGHKAFWQYPDNTREFATITELIYAPDHIKDGLYLLNIQTISLDLDVSPSKPVLFALNALKT